MKRRFLSLLGAATLLAGLVVVGGGAPVLAVTGGCNAGQIGNFPTDDALSANVTLDSTGNVATYTFTSTDENSSGGIPGLIEYCVYTTSAPDSVTTEAVGANGTPFTDPADATFSYLRGDGDPSNLPFDGQTVQMGTATWDAGAPALADQIILLHINDPAACTNLNGQVTLTCFVHPGTGGGCDVCAQGAALTIDKTASGSFTTTYTWDIAKSVNKTKVEQIGGTASFTYTVHVTHDAGTSGLETISGTITIGNDNTDAVDGVTVTDKLSDGTNCPVTAASDVSVPSGGATYDYSCTHAIATLTNTANVTWPDQLLADDGFLPGSGSTGLTSQVVNVDPVTQTFADDCTTVTDPVLSGGSSLDDPFPATVCVGETTPYVDGGAGTSASAGFTFTYHESYNVPAHNCTSYTNTATESTDGNTDSATVQVCGPALTGALTIGFWKTTNGQNLVNTYCGPAATGLGYYLEHLGAGAGPFSNAPTSCSSLKTYVYNILNGANAKNMNTMLKAQMLGTALDVWFSGAGWTSTTISKVKPPSTFLSHNNLGTFNMDLTAICPMVDNLSTGTATCKNNTPSTDGVAAGALPSSPMSMQAILDFASTTPSPFNGSTSSSVWYAGNATKEEILKNVFDQFNNGDAFGSF